MRKYLTLDDLIIIHQRLIDVFGGAYGLREINALESAMMRHKSGYYQNIIEEAAALMESLAMNHPFVDGNKRMAFFAADTFLRMNGFYIECDSEEAHALFMKMFETNAFNFKNLRDWLQKNVKSQV